MIARPDPVLLARATEIKVRYFDQEGKGRMLTLEGLEARVFQHEFDHLNGRLFIDYLGIAKRRMLKPELDEIRGRTPVTLDQVEPVVSHGEALY
jgi:peptide deformylase